MYKTLKKSPNNTNNLCVLSYFYGVIVYCVVIDLSATLIIEFLSSYHS